MEETVKGGKKIKQVKPGREKFCAVQGHICEAEAQTLSI